MPIYEFVCRDCGTQFEHMQSFSATGHPPCPACRSMHVSRRIGLPAVHFKGSGWYITDSKNSGKAAKSTAPGESSKAEAGKEAAASAAPANGAAKEGARESSKEGSKEAPAAAPAAGAAAAQPKPAATE